MSKLKQLATSEKPKQLNEANQIASIATRYGTTMFRSRLHAHWATFFDIAGWKWAYEPVDLAGWTPQFYVVFPCSHSECHGQHSLLIQILPLADIKDLDYQVQNGHTHFEAYGGPLNVNAVAVFGLGPRVTKWDMSHGSGGGIEDVTQWVDNADDCWNQAGNRLRGNFCADKDPHFSVTSPEENRYVDGKYPDSLGKATSDPFEYKLKLRTGELFSFSQADIRGEWVHLYPDMHIDRDRGVDVRLSEIVWCKDMGH